MFSKEQQHRKLVQRIREEFEERPCLRLSVPEASRFWALDEISCEMVLRDLQMHGFLAQGVDHRFQMYAPA